jgi:hypothetical protein
MTVKAEHLFGAVVSKLVDMEKIGNIEVRDVLAAAGREHLRLILRFTGIDGADVAVKVATDDVIGHKDESEHINGNDFKVQYFAFEATANDGTQYRINIVYRALGQLDVVGTWVVSESTARRPEPRIRRVGRASDPTDLLSTG